MGKSAGGNKKTRRNLLFLGFEHSGLYPNRCSAEKITSWYEEIFGFARKEEKGSFFLSGPGSGRLEIMKNAEGGTHMHVAVQVSDFEEAVAALQKKGIPLNKPLVGADLRIVYLRDPDPDGNPVHLWWAR
jgi:catechol 2,3-dioxygenase-like lactoylglutathione lyase family enzyme